MTFRDLEIQQIRVLSNLLIVLSLMGLLVSGFFVFREAYDMNKAGLESKLFPPTKDWTFREWRQDGDGRWSAEVYYYKSRPECRYVSGQLVTITFRNPNDRLIGESLVTFVGDVSEGNTRATGWQRMDDRIRFDRPDIERGALLRGEFLHQCHPGSPTVSGFRRIVVGEQMPWPKSSQIEN